MNKLLIGSVHCILHIFPILFDLWWPPVCQILNKEAHIQFYFNISNMTAKKQSLDCWAYIALWKCLALMLKQDLLSKVPHIFICHAVVSLYPGLKLQPSAVPDVNFLFHQKPYKHWMFSTTIGKKEKKRCLLKWSALRSVTQHRPTVLFPALRP